MDVAKDKVTPPTVPKYLISSLWIINNIHTTDILLHLVSTCIIVGQYTILIHGHQVTSPHLDFKYMQIDLLYNDE